MYGRSLQRSSQRILEQNMEIKGATLLYTLAGLMITFAGFSVLLLFIRPAAGAGGKKRVASLQNTKLPERSPPAKV
jgi:hypothetical protein